MQCSENSINNVYLLLILKNKMLTSKRNFGLPVNIYSVDCIIVFFSYNNDNSSDSDTVAMDERTIGGTTDEDKAALAASRIGILHALHAYFSLVLPIERTLWHCPLLTCRPFIHSNLSSSQSNSECFCADSDGNLVLPTMVLAA